MGETAKRKVVSFITPTNLSLLDLTTIGGSDKLGDETKIGQFCSGLKYALALFLRNNVEFEAHTVAYIPREPDDRRCDVRYSIGVSDVVDETIDYSKEVISVSVAYEYQCFHSYHTDDSSFSGLEDETFDTGISTNLGFDWKLEYALREIWSNMVDEGGYYVEEYVSGCDLKHGTVIRLSFDEGSDFDKIWAMRNSLFISKESVPINKFTYYDKTVEIYPNASETFKIYKQGILVFEDQNNNSKYCININFGKLDERRILIDESTTRYNIAVALSKFDDSMFEFMSTLDQGFINSIGYETIDIEIPEGFEAYVKTHIQNNGSISTLKYIYRALEFSPETPLATQRFKTINNLGVYNEQKEVVVSNVFKSPEEETKIITPDVLSKVLNNTKLDIKTNIIKKLKLDDIDFEMVEAEIKGSNVVADIINKRIYYTKKFDIDNTKDLEDFVIQYVEMKEIGSSIIRKLAKAFIKKGTS